MVEQLEFYASTGTARFTRTSHGQMKRQHCQPVVAFWRGGVRGHQHVCPLNCHAQLRFKVEKGFHVNSS